MLGWLCCLGAATISGAVGGMAGDVHGSFAHGGLSFSVVRVRELAGFLSLLAIRSTASNSLQPTVTAPRLSPVTSPNWA